MKSIPLGFKAFRINLARIFVFSAAYKILTSLILLPLFALLMQLFLQMGGEDLAFNDGIWRFALTLPGILCILVLVIAATVLIYFELATLIALAKQALLGEPRSIRSALIHTFWSFRTLQFPGGIFVALYTMVLLPLVSVGVTSSLLPKLTIPNFITGELTKTPLGSAALIALAAIILGAFICLLFVLPASVLSHNRFGAAVKSSVDTIRSFGPGILAVLLILAAIWALLFFVPRQLFYLFSGETSVTLLQAATWYGLTWRTPVLILVWVLSAVAHLALTPLLLTVLSSCYLSVNAPVPADAAVAGRIGERLDRWTGTAQTVLVALGRWLQSLWQSLMQRPFLRRHHRKLAAIVGVFAAIGLFIAFENPGTIHDPIVVGHRGSAYAVENTLESIQYAIDAGADYTEVDVLLSADGVPVVIHDSNLQRLSGQNKNVYDLTAEQLREIPLAQNDKTGRISTLEEVVAYCEGKILLAVEYKLHGKEQADLIDAVMRVMTASSYQKESVYISLDYALISQMKERYPAYSAGYCVYGNIGAMSMRTLNGLGMDFLLIEEGMATPELISACRKAWLPVYVWTVNDAETMQNYIDLGIVGLVTDYPDVGMDVLASEYDLASRYLPGDYRAGR